MVINRWWLNIYDRSEWIGGAQKHTAKTKANMKKSYFSFFCSQYYDIQLNSVRMKSSKQTKYVHYNRDSFYQVDLCSIWSLGLNILLITYNRVELCRKWSFGTEYFAHYNRVFTSPILLLPCFTVLWHLLLCLPLKTYFYIYNKI